MKFRLPIANLPRLSLDDEGYNYPWDIFYTEMLELLFKEDVKTTAISNEPEISTHIKILGDRRPLEYYSEYNEELSIENNIMEFKLPTADKPRLSLRDEEYNYPWNEFYIEMLELLAKYTEENVKATTISNETDISTHIKLGSTETEVH